MAEPVTGAGLAGIYRALLLSREGKREESEGELRLALGSATVDHVRARALQFLAQELCVHRQCLEMGRDAELADRIETECRELCERGLGEFSGRRWSNTVTHGLHAAMGSLDYLSGQYLSAKLHMRRCLEDHAAIWPSRERRCVDNLVGAQSVLAFIAWEEGDQASGEMLLRRAIDMLPWAERGDRYGHLVLLLLRSGQVEKAKKVLEGVIGRVSRHGAPKDVVSELKGYLAEAYIRTGKTAKAEALLKELDLSDEGIEWKKSARRWLEERALKKSP